MLSAAITASPLGRVAFENADATQATPATVAAAARAERATGADSARPVEAAASAGRGQGASGNGLGLSEAEQQVVEQLKKRDAEVRAHEQAHAQVGGEFAGAPSYEYETGPDGNRYAVAGEVPIDAAPVSGDPEATVEKMEVVKRAALAPAEPSSQDRAVAALADRQRATAQAELMQLKAAERRGETDQGGAGLFKTAEAGYAGGRAAQAAEAIVSIVAQAA